jgi:hypothetical protein
VKNFLIGCGLLVALVSVVLLIGAISRGINSYYIHNVNAYTLSVSPLRSPAYAHKITRIHVVGTNEKGIETIYDKSYELPVYSANTERFTMEGNYSHSSMVR